MSTDEQTGTALATQQQQEQMSPRPGILQPIASAADLVRAAKLHEQVRDALMTRDDYQVVRTKKGEQSFPISSYFNKIAVAYGASTVIKPGFPILHYGDDGQLLRAECIVIATIGGRTEEAYGACSIEEERFKNAQGAAKSFHDLPATSQTRARNRALGQMFGYGKQQPSWEEVEGSPDDPRRQDTPPQGTGTGRTPATSSRMNGKANTQPTASEGAQQALVDLGKSLAAIENGLEGAERHNEWDYIWGKAARTLGIKTRRLADLTVREAEQIGEELRRLAGTLNAPDDEVTDAEFSVATDDAETSEAQQGSLVADEI